jgi:putative PEP-CTERM system TPR-repeat lipoprotein
MNGISMMARFPGFALLALLLLAVAPQPATSSTASQRSYEFYESAISLFNKSDYRASIIQLKNALQQDPRNLAARVLLGRAYLRVGEGAEAEKQLWSARNAGADEALVLPPLGRALLLQQKYRLLLEEIREGVRPPRIEGEIRFLRGQAHLEQRNIGPAEKAFQDAVRMRPEDGETLLGMARLRHLEGKADEAEQYIDRALKLAPGMADAWYSKAEVLRGRRQFTEAVKFYDKAIDLEGGHIPARMARAASLIDSGRHDEAEEDVLYVRSALPDSTQAAYLQAMILTLNGKYEEASTILREAAQSLSAADPDAILSSPRAMLLRGVISYSRRQFDEAYPYLSRYVELVPHHAGARKMLGAILLRRNEPGPAVQILEPAAKATPNDVEILSLLGNAYMRSRNYAKATEVFEQAAKLAPDAASLKTRLALSQLAIGEQEAAIDGLEATVAASKRIGQADIILGITTLKSGNPADALTIAARLAEKEPDNPFPGNLAGLAHMRMGENAKARESFLHALELAADYTPAKFNLAALDMSEGKVADAKARYEEILSGAPNDIRAMTELSKIAEKAGETDTAIKWLDQVKKINPASVEPQLRLVDLYQRSNRVREAMALVLELEEKHPKHLDVLEAKAGLEVASGQTSKAIETLRLASYSAREIPDRLLRVADLQIKLRDFEGAQASLKTLISQKPDFLPAHIALVDLEAQSGGVEKALEMATALRNGYPELSIGDMLVGDMLVRTGQYAEAEAAYRAGLAKGNDAMFAIKLFQVRSRSGATDKAMAGLRAWDMENPGHAPVQRALATALMARGNVDEALRAHEAFVAKRPKDPVILNNLALLYLKKGDPRAVETAERAYSLAPSAPAIIDTYGWILVQQGKPSEGLRFLREAQARAATRLEIRYHVAAALARLDRRDEARQELESILKMGRSFSEEAAARDLLKSLQAD